MSQQRGKAATAYYQPPAPKIQAPPQPPTTGTPLPMVPSGRHKTRGGQRRLWKLTYTTLKGQFITLGSVSMLLTIALALFASLSFVRAANDLSTIVDGSVPSVNAAQSIAQYIDDIDAKAADYLATARLTDLAPCTIPGSSSTTPDLLTVHNCDNATLNAEIVLANQQIFAAAHNVTYPGEQTAVERIIEGFEEYNGHLAIMMHEFALADGSTDPTNPHLVLAYQAYQLATDVLHNKIERQALIDETSTLPNCTLDNNTTLSPHQWVDGGLDTNITCLSTINKTHLDQAYEDSMRFLGLTVALVIVLCVLICSTVGFTTLRMLFVTHRVVNPGLTLALVGCIIFSITTISFLGGLAGSQGAYGQIVKDDYDSVYYAAMLQRYGTDANADESRWLIALTFNDQSPQTGADHWQTDWDNNIAKVAALKQRAHANQTWQEEIQPLADMDTGWNKYTTIDGQIRAAAHTTTDPQHLNKAEELSTGASNTAFSQFADAVTSLSNANLKHYQATLNVTQGTLQTYILLSALLFPLFGLLTIWGIAQRLKEF